MIIIHNKMTSNIYNLCFSRRKILLGAFNSVSFLEGNIWKDAPSPPLCRIGWLKNRANGGLWKDHLTWFAGTIGAVTLRETTAPGGGHVPSWPIECGDADVCFIIPQILIKLVVLTSLLFPKPVFLVCILCIYIFNWLCVLRDALLYLQYICRSHAEGAGCVCVCVCVCVCACVSVHLRVCLYEY